MIGNALMQDPNQRQAMIDWLRQNGFDIGGMLPGSMGMPADPASAAPRGMGAMTAQEMDMMQQQKLRQRAQQMPGGSGWDGVNQKLNWLMQQKEMRAAAKKNPGGRAAPAGGGMGAVSDRELEAMNAQTPRSGSMTFGEIGKFLGRIF